MPRVRGSSAPPPPPPPPDPEPAEEDALADLLADAAESGDSTPAAPAPPVAGAPAGAPVPEKKKGAAHEDPAQHGHRSLSSGSATFGR